jgi:hypothetical protein
MPERGSVQFLLHFLGSQRVRAWKIGLAVALVSMLGMLPGEESLYHKAKTGLAQSLRQAAWKHALAGEPQTNPWPWDRATPAVYSEVPRLGLSAAVHYTADGQRSERTFEASRTSVAQDARDPHLLGDVAIGDRITVITADGSTRPYRVTGRQIFDPHSVQTLEPGAPPTPAAARPDSCSRFDKTLSGALHLIIEAIQGDQPPSPPKNDEQKL